MSNKIIHIGLPKTSTTHLQNNVLKKICEIENLSYYGKQSDYTLSANHKLFHLKYSIAYDFEPEKINLGENYLVSHEGLTGTDPFYWEKASQKINKSLGDDVQILMVLRDPVTFLNSVYMEACISKGYFIKPERYFLENKNYLLPDNYPKFNIEKFSYINLINSFKEKFKKLIVLKYEYLYEDNLLINALNFKKECNFILQTRSKSKVNKSISIRGLKVLNAINNMSLKFGFKLGYKRSNFLVSDFSIDEISKRMSSINKKKFTFRKNFIEFYRKYVDRVIGNGDVRINFDYLEKFKINELIEQYKSFEKAQIFVDGKKLK